MFIFNIEKTRTNMYAFKSSVGIFSYDFLLEPVLSYGLRFLSFMKNCLAISYL